MTDRRRWQFLALLLVGGLVAVSASAAPATVTLDAPESVEPGDTITISPTLTNTGDSRSEYILDVSGIPEGWEIEDRSDDGGQWKPAETKWLYLEVGAGASVQPSLTLSVPEDADNTSHELTVEAKDGDSVRDDASQTITVEAQSDTGNGNGEESGSGGGGGGGGVADTSTETPTATPAEAPTATPAEAPTATPAETPTEALTATPTGTDTSYTEETPTQSGQISGTPASDAGDVEASATATRGTSDSTETTRATPLPEDQSGLGIFPVAGVILVSALIAGVILVVLWKPTED